MNKKVKSLLVSGLLILGMTGNVFAEQAEEYQWKWRYTVEELTFPIGPTDDLPYPSQICEFQQGSIIAKITKLDANTSGYNYGHIVDIKWDATKFRVVKAIAKVAEEEKANKDNIYTEATSVEGEEGWKKAYFVLEPGMEVSSFEFIYELVDDDKDGIPDIKDDEVPDDEIKDGPATGDANTMVILGGTAVGAGALLIALNRKKDEDEE